MRLLYGTENPAKIKHMKEMLNGLDIEIIGLKDVELFIEPIDESGNSPLENAKIKAKAYYEVYKIPVFSCDSGLFIESVEKKNQPGVHVRRVNSKILNDEEMIEHYSRLSSELGDNTRARYRNAIYLIVDEESVFQQDDLDIASEEFIISAVPHENRNIGFPIDSLSIDIKSGKYYMDLEAYTVYEENTINGFRSFFIKVLNIREKNDRISHLEI